MDKLSIVTAALLAIASVAAFPTVVVQTSAPAIPQSSYTQSGYSSYMYYGGNAVYQPAYTYPAYTSSNNYGNSQLFQDGYNSGYNDGYRDGRNERIYAQYPYSGGRIYACAGCNYRSSYIPYPYVAPYYNGYSTVPMVYY